MENLLAPRDAATVLGITYPTLKAWIYRGKIQSIKTFVGRHRIAESETELLIPQKALSSGMEALKGYLQEISGRNQLIGRVLEVKYDALVAQVRLVIGRAARDVDY